MKRIILYVSLFVGLGCFSIAQAQTRMLVVKGKTCVGVSQYYKFNIQTQQHGAISLLNVLGASTTFPQVPGYFLFKNYKGKAYKNTFKTNRGSLVSFQPILMANNLILCAISFKCIKETGGRDVLVRVNGSADHCAISGVGTKANPVVITIKDPVK